MATGQRPLVEEVGPESGPQIVVPAREGVDSMENDALAERIGESRRSWRGLALWLRTITPRAIVRSLLVALALYGIFWLLHASWSLLLPFQIGLVLAYLLLPLVNRLSRRIPRWAAILIVFAGGLLVLVLGIGALVPPLADQIGTLIDTLPDTERITEMVAELQAFFSTLPPQVQEFVEGAASQGINTVRNNIASFLQGSISFLVTSLLSIFGTLTFILGFLVIPVWLFYVLNDLRSGRSLVDTIFPGWIREDVWAIWRIVDGTFSRYIRGQLVLGVAVGAASYIGLTILQMIGVQGIQYKLLLALIAGVTELIPYIGPILGAIPAILIALADSPQSALAVTALYVIIQQLENNILVPKITGDAVEINAAILTVVLIAVSQFGIIWVILAAPLAAILRDLYRYLYGRLQDPPKPAGVIPGDPLPAQKSLSVRAPPGGPAP